MGELFFLFWGLFLGFAVFWYNFSFFCTESRLWSTLESRLFNGANARVVVGRKGAKSKEVGAS